MAVRMELVRILISETQDSQLIQLGEVDGDRMLPIVIGSYEAGQIERRLSNLPHPRPWTHELLAHTIEALGGSLRSILINDLRDGTFYAQLQIQQDDETIEIDSRPSDAIALGVALEVPIYVEEHVLEEAST